MTLTSGNPKTEVKKKKKKWSHHENQSLKIHRVALEFFNMAYSSWIFGTFPNLYSNLRCLSHKDIS
jgi:hypothetical protein